MSTFVIIGGGPAAMMAASVLSCQHQVTVYEKGKTIGRKFLVAGKGGFNLTNSAEGKTLRSAYSPAGFLDEALKAFDSIALRQWLNDLGIPTFVGSSGRVFPKKGIKPIEVLNAIRQHLIDQGVHFRLEHEFIGFDDQQKPILRHQEHEFVPDANAYLFALGGASWSVTGSDGSWQKAFTDIGVPIVPFQSSNCGLNVHWPPQIKEYHLGKPLKNISVSVGAQMVKGEVLITAYGLEGNAIYPIVPKVRKYLQSEAASTIYLDLKPDNTREQLLKKLQGKPRSSATYARALNLDSVRMALLKNYTPKAVLENPQAFVEVVKSLPIPIDSLRPIEEAISTVGGIATNALQSDFSLKGFPSLFTIGEMVDWDTPTGGFLLQGCFAMGYWVGTRLNQ